MKNTLKKATETSAPLMNITKISKKTQNHKINL